VALHLTAQANSVRMNTDCHKEKMSRIASATVSGATAILALIIMTLWFTGFSELFVGALLGFSIHLIIIVGVASFFGWLLPSGEWILPVIYGVAAGVAGVSCLAAYVMSHV
jgi:hypothetical protein